MGDLYHLLHRSVNDALESASTSVADHLKLHVSGQEQISLSQFESMITIWRWRKAERVKLDGEPISEFGSKGVYLMQSGDTSRYKIGWSDDVSKRKSMLQTGNPDELNILTVIESEKPGERFLHSYLKDYRVRGEWFDLPDHIVRFLCSLKPASTDDLQAEHEFPESATGA